MKMVIAGGRDFRGTEADFQIVKKAVIENNITEIVSGCQVSRDVITGEKYGADYFGEVICARRLGLPVRSFPADWKKGLSAGPKRNKKMAEYTDYVFLFRGGKGTDSMRREATKAEKIIIYDNGWPK